MKMPKIVLLSALVSCALLSGCKDDKASAVTIEFMHSSVEQERQAVITKLIEKFEKRTPHHGETGAGGRRRLQHQGDYARENRGAAGGD